MWGDWHASLTGVIRSSEVGGVDDDRRGVPFMCSSGISNVCTPVDVTGNVTPVRERSAPNALMQGMVVTCAAPEAECQRNYGVVYVGDEGIAVCNKFASRDAIEPVTLATLVRHAREMALAAFWGVVAR